MRPMPSVISRWRRSWRRSICTQSRINYK